MRGFLIEEQCVGFRFCFGLGKIASDTLQMIRKLSLTIHAHLISWIQTWGKLQL
jgi:hypothetical protein